MRTVIALMLMSLAAVGCKKKEAEKLPVDPSPAVVAAEPAPVDPAVTEPATGAADQMTKRGGNCPSMVAGSSTTVTADGGVVTLTISAEEADAIASIQRRSAELLAEKQDPAMGGTHDQKGTYGGGMGKCPVVTVGATATQAKADKGVIITLTPAAGTTVEQLKATVEERVKLSAEYVAANLKPGDDVGNGGAVGGGKGDHGSNHSGKGDGKGKEEDKAKGTGGGTGGGGGKGTGGGDGGGKSK